MVGDERVALPGKEYELLVKLAGDPHRVFTKEELLREVWGFRSLGRTRTLDSHASRLRRRLARPDRPPYVQTFGASATACSATGLARPMESALAIAAATWAIAMALAAR